MTKLITTRDPHILTVLDPNVGEDPNYEIAWPPEDNTRGYFSIETAISDLREAGHSSVQVVNGHEVYLLTWGPLLPPWEGQPG